MSKDYQEALESEQKVKQLIEHLTKSISQIRQYKVEYTADLEKLENNLNPYGDIKGSPADEKIVRTRKFLEQLDQMESDQVRQRKDMYKRLLLSKNHTINELKKLEKNNDS